jgi:hypothetical protein
VAGIEARLSTIAPYSTSYEVVDKPVADSGAFYAALEYLRHCKAWL